jgi:hypothetical protein
MQSYEYVASYRALFGKAGQIFCSNNKYVGVLKFSLVLWHCNCKIDAKDSCTSSATGPNMRKRGERYGTKFKGW